jgi:hypothetical protein
MKKFLLLWFVAASLIALLLYPLNMPRLSPLATKGIQTCGTVTAFEPNNHQEVHYSFVANGKTYSGAQQGGAGDQQNALACAAGSSGLVVYYLPETPEISCAGNPRSLCKNEVISIGLAMVILPLFALLGTRWRYPRFCRWLAS